ncbi:hypothetical protein J6590_036036 [Homalodisca vitripennis]|nr:hypothetical protein J6590_036036 [Homalodisca vitripennis]
MANGTLPNHPRQQETLNEKRKAPINRPHEERRIGSARQNTNGFPTSLEVTAGGWGLRPRAARARVLAPPTAPLPDVINGFHRKSYKGKPFVPPDVTGDGLRFPGRNPVKPEE